MKCREGDSQEGATCNQKTRCNQNLEVHTRKMFLRLRVHTYIHVKSQPPLFLSVARLHVNLVMEGDYVALLKQKLWKKNCRVFAGWLHVDCRGNKWYTVMGLNLVPRWQHVSYCMLWRSVVFLGCARWKLLQGAFLWRIIASCFILLIPLSSSILPLNSSCVHTVAVIWLCCRNWIRWSGKTGTR